MIFSDEDKVLMNSAAIEIGIAANISPLDEYEYDFNYLDLYSIEGYDDENRV